MEADRLNHRNAYSNMPDDKKEVFVIFDNGPLPHCQFVFQALRQARKLRNASLSEEEKEVGNAAHSVTSSQEYCYPNQKRRCKDRLRHKQKYSLLSPESIEVLH